MPKEHLVNLLHSENLRVENEFQVFKGLYLQLIDKVTCMVYDNTKLFSPYPCQCISNALICICMSWH